MSSLLMFITPSDINAISKLHACNKYNAVILIWSSMMYIHKQRIIFNADVDFK